MSKDYVYFASWGKSTPTSILPTTNHIWLKAKWLQWCFSLMRDNKNSLFYMGRSGLYRTEDFQKFCGSGLDRIQFYRIRTGLRLKIFTVRSSLTESPKLSLSPGTGNPRYATASSVVCFFVKSFHVCYCNMILLRCLSLCNTQAPAVNQIPMRCWRWIRFLCDVEGVTQARGC